MRPPWAFGERQRITDNWTVTLVKMIYCCLCQKAADQEIHKTKAVDCFTFTIPAVCPELYVYTEDADRFTQKCLVKLFSFFNNIIFNKTFNINYFPKYTATVLPVNRNLLHKLSHYFVGGGTSYLGTCPTFFVYKCIKMGVHCPLTFGYATNLLNL